MATTFLIYDDITQGWSTQNYTLAELALMPEITESTHICTANGKRTLTYSEACEITDNGRLDIIDEEEESEAENETGEQTDAEQPPAPAPQYDYLVIQHCKSAGFLGSGFDVEGLQAKLNLAAAHGYRLVGVCSPTFGTGAQALSFFASGDASNAMQIQGVVAIMEKRLSAD